MILWVKHHAWLHATPGSDKAENKDDRSRAKRMNLDLHDIDMPPLDGADWLIEWLFDAGPVGNDGMGQRGLTWSELQAWRDLTGTLITAPEARALRTLSQAYAAASAAAQKEHCKPFWESPQIAEIQARQSEQAGNALAMLFRAKAAASQSAAS